MVLTTMRENAFPRMLLSLSSKSSMQQKRVALCSDCCVDVPCHRKYKVNWREHMTNRSNLMQQDKGQHVSSAMLHVRMQPGERDEGLHQRLSHGVAKELHWKCLDALCRQPRKAQQSTAIPCATDRAERQHWLAHKLCAVQHAACFQSSYQQ